MLRDRFIICIASSWDVDPTSKHHVMRRLAADNDVLWVNYHGSRRPQCNRRDAGAALRALRRVAGGVREIGPRMRQLTPFVLPGSPTPARGRLNRLLLCPQIARAMRGWRKPDQPVQLWTFAPDIDYLAGAFGEEALVYYCVDEFSEFEGFDGPAVAAAERRLMAGADVVFTTAARLHEKRRGLHPHVHLVRHGVDHGHFARAVAEELPLPDDLGEVPGPRAGFIGLLHHWFDVQLVAAVARRLPDVSFVLIGDVQTEVAALRVLPNVFLLGRKPYAELPAYCRAFAVGLIPFVRSSMTENVNPIKLREYLAAGLPVVSTALPEVRCAAEELGRAEDASGGASICLADAADDFAAGIRQALQGDDLAARRARSIAVADQTWDAITARVSRIVAASVPAPLAAPNVVPAAIA